MDTTLLYGIAVIPAIVGLVQVTKDLGVPGRFAPALAVLFGLAAGFAQFYAAHLPWIPAAVTGIALGLSAVGLYSGARTVAQSVSFSPQTSTFPREETDSATIPPLIAPDTTPAPATARTQSSTPSDATHNP